MYLMFYGKLYLISSWVASSFWRLFITLVFCEETGLILLYRRKEIATQINQYHRTCFRHDNFFFFSRETTMHNMEVLTVVAQELSKP